MVSTYVDTQSTPASWDAVHYNQLGRRFVTYITVIVIGVEWKAGMTVAIRSMPQYEAFSPLPFFVCFFTPIHFLSQIYSGLQGRFLNMNNLLTLGSAIIIVWSQMVVAWSPRFMSAFSLITASIPKASAIDVLISHGALRTTASEY